MCQTLSGTALASLHCSHHFHRSSLTSHHTSLTPLSTPILYPFSSHTTLNTNLTHCCLSHTPLSTPSQATASLLPSVTKTSHLTLLPLFLSLSHSLSLSSLSSLSLSLSLSHTHTHTHTHTMPLKNTSRWNGRQHQSRHKLFICAHGQRQVGKSVYAKLCRA